MRCCTATSAGPQLGPCRSPSLLGALFTCVQALEYSRRRLRLVSGNLYGATFFMATGFHGFHVLIGTIFLIVCLVRAMTDQFTPKHHLGFEFAAWYWHFVDVVWLFLFAAIYVWGSWGVAIHQLSGSISSREARRRAAPCGASRRRPALWRARRPADRTDRRRRPFARPACRCPRCGEGPLFAGFLTVRSAATAAGSTSPLPTAAKGRRCSSS